VQSGQFPHPRIVNPDVPASLEAICLKAMSRNPKDRYSTAKALLADLKAWMADEPGVAWTEPLSIRARRWVRGHQVAVGIAATALLILAMVSPVMTLQRRSSSELRKLRKRKPSVRRSKPKPNGRKPSPPGKKLKRHWLVPTTSWPRRDGTTIVWRTHASYCKKCLYSIGISNGTWRVANSRARM
jgi:hypothetical protein